MIQRYMLWHHEEIDSDPNGDIVFYIDAMKLIAEKESEKVESVKQAYKHAFEIAEDYVRHALFPNEDALVEKIRNGIDDAIRQAAEKE